MLNIKEDIYYQKLLDRFTSTLSTSQYVITRQTEGITHADSIKQLPFRGNCMNWVLGHIISSRGRMLRLLNEDLPLTEAENTYYQSGSEPITDDSYALPFERLMEMLRQTTEQITNAVNDSSEEFLTEIIDDEKGSTRLDTLSGLIWHETYHVGQFEYLRQAVGKNDKIF